MDGDFLAPSVFYDMEMATTVFLWALSLFADT